MKTNTSWQGRCYNRLCSIEVFVLVISHKHGEDVSVHRTNEGAMEELYQFVQEWWESRMEGPLPSDKADAISAYFTEMSDGCGEENYSTRRVLIQD